MGCSCLSQPERPRAAPQTPHGQPQPAVKAARLPSACHYRANSHFTDFLEVVGFLNLSYLVLCSKSIGSRDGKLLPFPLYFRKLWDGCAPSEPMGAGRPPSFRTGSGRGAGGPSFISADQSNHGLQAPSGILIAEQGDVGSFLLGAAFDGPCFSAFCLDVRCPQISYLGLFWIGEKLCKLIRELLHSKEFLPLQKVPCLGSLRHQARCSWEFVYRAGRD